MDLKTLKSEHHNVFAAAVQEGSEKGTATERDRVVAHLTMGEASGDMKSAVTAIKDGVEMTSSMQATYMAAGMNRTDTDTRSAEEIALAEAADNAAGDDNINAAADLVASGVEAKLGTKVEA